MPSGDYQGVGGASVPVQQQYLGLVADGRLQLSDGSYLLLAADLLPDLSSFTGVGYVLQGVVP